MCGKTSRILGRPDDDDDDDDDDEKLRVLYIAELISNHQSAVPSHKSLSLLNELCIKPIYIYAKTHQAKTRNTVNTPFASPTHKANKQALDHRCQKLEGHLTSHLSNSTPHRHRRQQHPSPHNSSDSFPVLPPWGP